MDIRLACSILTRHFLKAEMKACEYTEQSCSLFFRIFICIQYAFISLAVGWVIT